MCPPNDELARCEDLSGHQRASTASIISDEASRDTHKPLLTLNGGPTTIIGITLPPNSSHKLKFGGASPRVSPLDTTSRGENRAAPSGSKFSARGSTEHDIRGLLQIPEENLSVAAAAQRKLRQPPSTRNASSSFDTSTSEYAHFFTVRNDVMESSVPLGTRRVDDQAFAAWTAFCKESTSAGTSPISPWRPSAIELDAAGRNQEKRLMSAFALWYYSKMKPKSQTFPAPKPQAAMAMVAAVRRVHNRMRIDMRGSLQCYRHSSEVS
jgi:hypothetical protein